MSTQTLCEEGAIVVNIVLQRYFISKNSSAEVVFLAVLSLHITEVYLPDVIIELSLLTFDIFES